jgi:alpha-beta hydrolase superfamily lysophospholipase/uncharacterized membrane protein
MTDPQTFRARLIRLAIWLLIVLAVFAAIGLLIEVSKMARGVPGQSQDFRLLSVAGLIAANLVFTAVLAIVAVLFLWVRVASSLPNLRGWHMQRPTSEFTARDAIPGYTLQDYLRQEDRVFAELDELINDAWEEEVRGEYSRYCKDSPCNPAAILDRNWNRSCVLQAPNPIGGVLLIHGLSDAPYSLRVLGQRLHSEGYTVVWLRVPGHGTCPAALARVSRHDWTAAVKIAASGLGELLPPGSPITLAGYSNGGALSVHYALEALDDPSLPQVKALLLFSPMIGINPMARITRVYHTVALVSGNRKAQWASVNAEIDPFKYNSWPMNGNVQAWAMTQAVEQRLSRLQKAGRMREMPPVLAMQSAVDETVVVSKLITVLFDRLQCQSSELFLYDVNRAGVLSNLLNLSFEKAVVPKLKRMDLPFRLSIVTNAGMDSQQVVLRTRDGGTFSEQPLQQFWPDGYVSLSHVAVPFAPEDPIYGTAEATAFTGISLGTLSLRAEPSALQIPTSLFARSRHNPFYAFMQEYILQWLAKNSVASPEAREKDRTS